MQYSMYNEMYLPPNWVWLNNYWVWLHYGLPIVANNWCSIEIFVQQICNKMCFE